MLKFLGGFFVIVIFIAIYFLIAGFIIIITKEVFMKIKKGILFIWKKLGA